VDKLIRITIYNLPDSCKFIIDLIWISMQSSKKIFLHYLSVAKKIYTEEQSFPSVYRELIKDIEPDLAIAIITELKAINLPTSTESYQLS
jgi:hypothetical protein